MIEPNGKLLTNLRWFLDCLDRTPERIHTRGIWSDPQDGAGSKLGSKKTSREFADFIEASPKARRTERTEVECFHVGVDREGGESCLACMAYDVDGMPIGESGTRESISEVYRWPMRAAIARLAADHVRPGRPPLDVTLRTLARHSGDLQSTREVLARRWPVVGIEEEFYRHIAFALNRVRRVFREDAPPPRERSEAQINAENEGTRESSLA